MEHQSLSLICLPIRVERLFVFEYLLMTVTVGNRLNRYRLQESVQTLVGDNTAGT